MKIVKTSILIIILMTTLYAKEQSYCFENPQLFLDDKNIRQFVFVVKDLNLSSEYQEGVELFYTLKNGHTHKAEDSYCMYDKKKSLFKCNNDITDGGWVEFNVKTKKMNIEEFCTYDCMVHITPPIFFEDDTSSYHPLEITTDRTNEYITILHYPLDYGGTLDTMPSASKRNDREKTFWIKGKSCNFQKPSTYYSIHEYKKAFSKPKRDSMFKHFNEMIESKETITLKLHKAYSDIASMMENEGFKSNWINPSHIELFIYSNNRALVKIKTSSKSSNRKSCLSNGYYLLELNRNSLLIKNLQTSK